MRQCSNSMKKRKQAFEDGPSGKATAVHVSEKSDAEDDDSQEIVDVDFEFFDPKEEDFHGVKALLRTYLDDSTWDLGGFVDIILGQPTVGTVVKTAEDESPIGVITVLNLGRYKLAENELQQRDNAENQALIDGVHIPDDVGPLLINVDHWGRRSTRVTRQPERFQRSMDSILLTDEGEPLTFKEAQSCEDKSKWELAMKSEMQSLYANNTWELVPLPKGRKAIPNKWVYKGKSSLVHVYNFLERNVSDSTKLEVFNHNSSEVGLLISERLINIPEELAPPLYEGLLDEVSWAIEDEPTKFLRDSFKFKQYLVLSRIFQELPKKKKKNSLKKQKKQRKQQSASGNEREDIEEIVYIKPEDELFHRLSHWSCKFPANSEAAAAHEIQGLKQFRLVMLLNAESMELFKSQFCKVER
ncbi:hypothetical protein L7F22_059319 [Adiantum nelumboides]|nr:hypothetical protein [Adiantum nelumboides]